MHRFAFFTWLIPLCLNPCASAQDKVEIKTKIIYRKVDGVDLYLDFAKPPKGDGPFPLVVCVHGGAWVTGNPAGHHRTLRLLAAKGYAAATVQYRLAPKSKFPAQIEDVREAIRFLRGNAKDWGLNADKVAVLGDSAGGHISLLVGLMDPPSEEKISSRPQAIVNFYGPTDFRVWKLPAKGEALLLIGLKKTSNQILVDLLGTSNRKTEIMAFASPITHIDAKDPAVLTLQGTVDPLVPDDQARILHRALEKAGVPNRLEIIEGASHGWGGTHLQRTDRAVEEFLEKYLK